MFIEKIRVTIWDEFRHEKTKENVKALYPNGLHTLIGEFLAESGEMEVTLAALDDPDQGLPESVLENTDVLLWWGHMVHHEMDDALIFGSWFEEGHIFRSGACFIRGAGKIFYFQLGHESCPSFYNPYVRRIITNAVYWAKPGEIGYPIDAGFPHITRVVTEEFGGKYSKEKEPRQPTRLFCFLY